MASNNLEEAFDAAVADNSPDRLMAGAVLLAADESGIKYSKTFGRTSLDPSAPEFSTDTVMWLASCTKLLTSIATLQCVERGLLDLDDDIGNVLPEWKNPQVLTGFEDGKPTLQPPAAKVTLRLLVSHQSGAMYPQMHPNLIKYVEVERYDLDWPSGDISKNFGLPLAFEPGTGWGYGPGLDWAGKAIEKVNGGIKLGEYMDKNIFQPLGMRDIGMRIGEREDLSSRLMTATQRGDEIYVNPFAERPATKPPLKSQPNMDQQPVHPKDDHGGSGLFGTGAAYMKLLVAILQKDPRLLKPETYDLMHETQVAQPMAPMPINGVFASIARAAGQGLMGPQWDHGLCGAICRSELPGIIREGSLHWTGMANTSWIVDRKSGIVTFFGTNHFPYEDYDVCDLQVKFHGAMLERFGKSSKL